MAVHSGQSQDEGALRQVGPYKGRLRQDHIARGLAAAAPLATAPRLLSLLTKVPYVSGERSKVTFVKIISLRNGHAAAWKGVAGWRLRSW